MLRVHHPGPPHILSVDERRQLGPSDPTLDGEYKWRIVESPPEATLSLDESAVVDFDPSEPGLYRLELDAPDGTHTLTVLVVPRERKSVELTRPESEIQGENPPEKIPIIGSFNNYTAGRDYATLEDGKYSFTAALDPGNHSFCMTNGANFDDRGPWRNVRVTGPGRPQIGLSVERNDDRVIVSAETRRPDGTPDDDIDVAFIPDDRDSADVRIEERRIVVPSSELRDEDLRVYAVAVGERRSGVEMIRLGGSAVEYPLEPPDWVRDAVIYEVYVRSFASSFEELRERVSYLDDLGVDCVWLTPVTSRDGEEHGYRQTDLTSVATDLGTIREFEAFVSECHERGIRVVFDFVVNHVSTEHPKFQRAVKDGEYREWFNWVDDKPENGHEYRFDWDGTVNLNFESLQVRERILEVVDFWAERVDGFRCDFVRGVPRGFWKEIRERVKATDPEFLLIGESLPNDPLIHEFDVQYGVDLYHRLLEIGWGNLPAATLLDVPDERRRKGFGDATPLLQYSEDHDVKRYRENVGEDQWPAAVAATFTLPGIPKVYAGQEMGATEKREWLPWSDVDEAALQLHRTLIDLYEKHPALRRGEFKPIQWRAASDRVVAFERTLDSDRIVVVLNFGAEPILATVSTNVSRDLFRDEPITQPFPVESFKIIECP